MRLGIALSTAAVSTIALLAACLPDPKGEYQDYLDRTSNEPKPNGGGQTDASIDTKPPETAVEALYVGICVTSLAARDPNQALRFYTETKFTPDPAGGGGKITMNVTPLRGWDPNSPPSGAPVTPAGVSKSETRGATITAADVPVAAGQGRFTANLGTINLAGEANSISGRDAVIEGAVLDGRFGSGDRFCSTLGGQLTKPYGFTFDPAQNTCLFVKAKEGDKIPTIDAAEFVCPL